MFYGLDYDVSVITIDPPIKYGPNATWLNLTSSEPIAGDNATISGWGTEHVSYNRTRTFPATELSSTLSSSVDVDLSKKRGTENFSN